MSFAGIYNLTLNGGAPSANSAVVATSGVNLVPIDKNDPKQKWSIRPIGGVDANAYTIQSAYTGAYVVPNGSTLTYSLNPYAWFITGTSSFIRTNTGSSTLNWLPSDNGQFVLITGNTQWTWTIAA